MLNPIFNDLGTDTTNISYIYYMCTDNDETRDALNKLFAGLELPQPFSGETVNSKYVMKNGADGNWLDIETKILDLQAQENLYAGIKDKMSPPEIEPTPAE
jgi:hypothetical protein